MLMLVVAIVIFLAALVVLSLLLPRAQKLTSGLQALSTLVAAAATASLAFFGWVQWEETQRLGAMQRTANWEDLRNGMWDIFDQYPLIGGVEALRSLSTPEKVMWAQSVRRLLDSQAKNPVLVEDKECLGYWRNAIAGAKGIATLLQIARGPDVDDRFIGSATGILRDVGHVWDRLVLESDEVSAVGGHPQEKD